MCLSRYSVFSCQQNFACCYFFIPREYYEYSCRNLSYFLKLFMLIFSADYFKNKHFVKTNGY